MKTLQQKIIILLLCAGSLACCFRLSAQVTHAVFQPGFDQKKLRNHVLPFDRVEVMDARFDTALFYAPQSGFYPPERLGFKNGLANATRDFFNAALSWLPHTRNTLLIKVNELRIPNRPFIPRTQHKPGADIGRFYHHYVYYDLELFLHAADSGCYKIAQLSGRSYAGSYPDFFNDAIERIFMNTLKVAILGSHLPDSSKKECAKLRTSLLKEEVAAEFFQDSSLIALKTISRGSMERWATLPATQGSFEGNGIFASFDDFKNNSFIPGGVIKDSVEKDSIFHFTIPHPANGKAPVRPCWALVYEGKCYINLYRDVYLPLTRVRGCYYFYVPSSLPDMYAILSYESYAAAGNSGDYGAGGGPAAILLSAIVQGAVESHEKKLHKRLTDAEGLKQHYRYCVVDMDNGDFMYYDRDPFYRNTF